VEAVHNKYIDRARNKKLDNKREKLIIEIHKVARLAEFGKIFKKTCDVFKDRPRKRLKRKLINYSKCHSISL
jgi:hypothetical protein